MKLDNFLLLVRTSFWKTLWPGRIWKGDKDWKKKTTKKPLENEKKEQRESVIYQLQTEI